VVVAGWRLCRVCWQRPVANSNQISNAVSCSAKKGAVAWEETGGLAVGLGTTVVGDGKGDVVPKGDDGWMECG